MSSLIYFDGIWGIKNGLSIGIFSIFAQVGYVYNVKHSITVVLFYRPTCALVERKAAQKSHKKNENNHLSYFLLKM